MEVVWGWILLWASSHEITLPTVDVKADKSGGPREIQTWVLPRPQQGFGAQNWSTGASYSPGLQATTGCAFCGTSLVSLVGVRFDQVTYWVDGLPLLSPLAIFYGLDPLPPQAVGNIHGDLGPGSHPFQGEVLAGAINFESQPIFRNQNRLAWSSSHRGEQSLTLEQDRFSPHQAWRVGLWIWQQQPWDLDGNRIAENPGILKSNIYVKWQNPEKPDSFWQGGYQQQDIKGGHLWAKRVWQAPQTTYPWDFEDGDVRKAFGGNPQDLLNWTLVDRAWLMYHSTMGSQRWSVGGSFQNTRSVLIHGYQTRYQENVQALAWQKNLTPDSTLWLQARRAETLHTPDKNRKLDSGLAHWAVLGYSDQWLYSSWGWRFQSHVGYAQGQWSDGYSISEPAWGLGATFWRQIRWVQVFVSVGKGWQLPSAPKEFFHAAAAHDSPIQRKHLPTSEFIQVGWVAHRGGRWELLGQQIGFRHGLSYDPQANAVYQNPQVIPVKTLIMAYQWVGPVSGRWGWEWVDWDRRYQRSLPTALARSRLFFQINYQNPRWEGGLRAQIIPAQSLKDFDDYQNYWYQVDPGWTLKTPALKHSPAFYLIDVTLTRYFKNGLWLSLFGENLLNSHQGSALAWHAHNGHTHLENALIYGPLTGQRVGLSIGLNW